LRAAGFDLWEADEPEGGDDDDDDFTPGNSTLAKTYNGKKIVKTLVFAKSVYLSIKGSVIEGRRYRATKVRIDSEMDQIVTESQPAWDDYIQSLNKLRRLKHLVAAQACPATFEQKEQHASISAEFRQKQNAYRAYKMRMLVPKIKLRTAEQ
jgi:hypothetical protein